MAAVDLPAPRAGLNISAAARSGAAASTGVTGTGAISSGLGDSVVLDTGRGYALWVFDAGLACCAVECAAALSRVGGAAGPQPVQASVFIVAGTVTDKLAPLVLQAYQRVPEPRLVLSFGACSNSGGPYWDSYCVTKGVDQIIPVDVYVPGCPPRPEALLHGLGVLAQQHRAADDLAGRP